MLDKGSKVKVSKSVYDGLVNSPNNYTPTFVGAGSQFEERYGTFLAFTQDGSAIVQFGQKLEFVSLYLITVLEDT